MRWVTFTPGLGALDQVGVLKGNAVYPLLDLPPGHGLLDLLGDDGTRLRLAAQRALARPSGIPVDSVSLRAPLPEPRSLRDGLGFLDHIKGCLIAAGQMSAHDELDEVWHQTPAYYYSNHHSIMGPHDDVEIFPGSNAFDFELEVAAVLGDGGRDLDLTEAQERIIGYTLMCDWTARDHQIDERLQHIGPAKSKDCGTSMGPWLLTADEFNVEAFVGIHLNGEVIAVGNPAGMDWDFASLISYMSRGVEMRAGDVIGSGTVPGGCLLERTKNLDNFTGLQPGDIVELSGEQLGSTRHTVLPATDVHLLKSGY
ncbi:fumarylacetoacetate hydrolase family protein [Streptomyces sp. NPDC059002]|uniref:fumarylacetoacetate hydrolase family protein n=1 Tax=Streptomyces sp. NPDC059002 TaxID=3346690 RepID=UPI00368564BD